ncbi:MAG: cupin domain-containing protein [Deltaproteobacteria bacterium]|jgi:quercetin dioxygenase-like cupin family protein|nr:cupin domain-containing protein [Deltaproteobacteria bacterium]
MTIFYKNEQIAFGPHPRFEGVRIAKLVTKDQGQAIGVSMLEIGAGVEIPVHTHEQELDSILVMSGRGQAFIDGVWREINEGDYLLIPATIEHGVRNTSQQVLKLFIVHSPAIF